ncbi:MAG: teichoic acid ABC transporter ATP-binding protein [Chloroflexi bacterium HGW-Chloroflexi-6]|nr:MAG: teichoic acid ABC transporter ATP-binding protein [Chloroflexi bacterium HGW-Chloroflexi-6]
MKSHTAPDFSETVIGVEHVSVRYLIPRERVGSLKEYAIRKIQRRIFNDEFWALKDVSFEIKRGEIFGVIGANGAGKSTLLKLMARIMRPSAGRVWVKGRVAPLLAMGAGFHPELSGRENVFLNGTLLGYSEKQIRERFDCIVEFAELQDFIDAPIRTYSSGMLARLGFAVATDQKPDILIVDEALAVGDTAFQQKSLNRIREFQQTGTTTLYVSHALGEVEKTCKRAAWLHHGKLMFIGDAQEAVDRYLNRKPVAK